MGKLFNYDSGIMAVLNKIVDLIILNLLFVVCCIPILTIGPSLSALYAVTLKMVKNEETYMFKGFFKAFKLNFKISFLSWLILFACLILLIFDQYIARTISSTIGTVLQYLFIAVLFLWIIIMMFLFPYIARFENSLKDSFKNAFLLSVINLPYTLIILAISGLIGYLLVFKIAFQSSLLIFLLIGFSGMAFLNSIFFRIIFKKIEPKIEAPNEDYAD